MFDRSVTTGPFSLRHGHDCCALSIGVVLNEDGSLGETIIQPSTIRVTTRMTFSQVERALDGELTVDNLPHLQALQQVCALEQGCGPACQTALACAQ